MSQPTVLVSGAGIAGPTLAYWLARRGFRPTVVERGAALRSSGSPVDVRGPAVVVAEQMGLMARLRDAATQVSALSFIEESGREVGRVNLRALQRASGSREVELPRGDLASILYQASQDSAEFLFGDSITALSQDAHGVDVTFGRAAPRRFDLVVGADGLHSTVRRLAFGPESDFVRHMGIFIATLPLERPLGDAREVILYNTPGRAISLHPSRAKALAAFMFRGPLEEGFDHRDTERHKRLLTDAFSDDAWRVPELRRSIHATSELYFDSVSQVRLSQWAQGRVALLGDAASCISLFGDGSSLAMAGAFTLAHALAAHPGDPRAAFRQYEAEHRTWVEPRQRNSALAASLLVPATRHGIRARNLATRLWPVAAVAGWLRHNLSEVRARAQECPG
ncbi:monooxygenase [Corallococcus sp. H22C18031201]|uniref:FAD-dependent monooxygenase n=1 Tax=Citreicoccus inhibens TaxID=2849499 RepID=UPI000E757862|nr:FAD-dependent monooxygenase [Citreicoccus inhibens]MBU8898338.1 FAD-dependent monooxygenase [Citreicoccus inhibens]RJS15597.1 monooxygenase [Corallococcus sp. H22C18031201]